MNSKDLYLTSLKLLNANDGTMNLGKLVFYDKLNDCLITNNGTLSIVGGNHVRLDNNGTAEITNSYFYNENAPAIDNKGTLVINSGTYKSDSSTNTITNSGTLTLNGGVYYNDYEFVNGYGTRRYAGHIIDNTSTGTINIDGNVSYYRRFIVNEGILNVNNATVSDGGRNLVFVESTNEVNLYNSSVVSINNTGITRINNSSVTYPSEEIDTSDDNNKIGTLVTKGKLIIEGNSNISGLAKISCDDANDDISISNSTLNLIKNTCDRVNIDSSIITKLNDNDGDIVITNSEIGNIETSYDSNIHIKSGSVTDGIINNGTLIIGEIGHNVSTTDPIIVGDEFGILNSEFGTIKFYDGIVKGSQGGISGLVVEVEPGYTLKHTNEEDDTISTTLKLIGADDARVAVVSNLNFDSLQAAINYAANNDINAVLLYANIVLENDLVVPGGKTVTIYLNDYTITQGSYEIDSNIILSNEEYNVSGSIFDIFRNGNTKNIIVYEMEDGSKLLSNETYKLYKFDDNEYEIVKMNREEEVGRYTRGNKIEEMTTVRSRIYINNLTSGQYKLVDNNGLELSFSISDDGKVSDNVIDNINDDSQAKVTSSAIATLILTIQTGGYKSLLYVLMVLVLIIIGLLLAIRKRKLNN